LFIVSGPGRTALVAVEIALLLTGVGAFLWARADRWELKAAVATALRVARQFQPAAQVLGEQTLEDFPQVTLWRAAQPAPSSTSSVFSPDNEERLMGLRRQLSSLIEETEGTVARSSALVRFGTAGLIIAGLLAMPCNGWLAIVSHLEVVEGVYVWLPSLMGAFQAVRQRQRVLGLVPLLSELNFIRSRLLVFASWDEKESRKKSAGREAALRHLCKVIGQYGQTRLGLAIWQWRFRSG
jgi:hypothetical protein